MSPSGGLFARRVLSDSDKWSSSCSNMSPNTVGFPHYQEKTMPVPLAMNKSVRSLDRRKIKPIYNLNVMRKKQALKVEAGVSSSPASSSFPACHSTVVHDLHALSFTIVLKWHQPGVWWDKSVPHVKQGLTLALMRRSRSIEGKGWWVRVDPDSHLKYNNNFFFLPLATW